MVFFAISLCLYLLFIFTSTKINGSQPDAFWFCHGDLIIVFSFILLHLFFCVFHLFYFAFYQFGSQWKSLCMYGWVCVCVLFSFHLFATFFHLSVSPSLCIRHATDAGCIQWVTLNFNGTTKDTRKKKLSAFLMRIYFISGAMLMLMHLRGFQSLVLIW